MSCKFSLKDFCIANSVIQISADQKSGKNQLMLPKTSETPPTMCLSIAEEAGPRLSQQFRSNWLFQYILVGVGPRVCFLGI